MINTVRSEIDSLRNAKSEKVVKEMAVDLNKGGINDDELNELYKRFAEIE